MVGHHVVCSGVALHTQDPVYPDGGTELLHSVSPGRIRRYKGRMPVGAFTFPMDDYTMTPGIENMSYDEMLAYVQGTGRTWWIARVYKNYTGLLDMYVQFAYSDAVVRFILDFDMTEVQVGRDYDGWPRPVDFYLARRAIPTNDYWRLEVYNIGGYPEQIANGPIEAVSYTHLTLPTKRIV